MIRHGLHILGLAKGILLLAALLIFVAGGGSGELIAMLESRFENWKVFLYLFYWILVLFGGLLLTYPLALIQDHLAHANQNHHEELGTFYWVKGLLGEIFIGAIILGLFSGVMVFLPSLWWLVLSLVWVGYQGLQPVMEKIMFKSHAETRESLPELLADLKPRLEAIGIKTVDAHPLDEDDVPSIERDVILLSRGPETSVYVPREWTHDWDHDEIASVVLHKAWTGRSASHMRDVLIHAVSATFCLGGFMLLYPLAAKLLSLHEPHVLTVATVLAAWLIPAMFVFRICVHPLYRKWMYEADDFVVAQMGTAQPLISVLNRASDMAPADADVPDWAEILFFGTPSLRRRIARQNKSHT
ncbi:MAG TPA: hypothetical protein PJ991_04155 [Kiritimatiellia bacterium]|nr:hypothetical protein [Kiritimatiellia bacterium]